MRVHCDVLKYLDKQALQQAALFIVNNASKFAISTKMASDGIDYVNVSSPVDGVFEALFDEAEWVDVDPVRAALTPSLCEDHDFLRCNCELVDIECDFLDVVSCLCNWCRRV